MADKLQELIQQLAKSNPQFLEGLEKAAAAGIQNDKLKLYNMFIKDNTKFLYQDLDKVLTRYENQRLDINWNKEDFIYRLVISKRKKLPEKIKKARKTNASNTASSNEAKATGT